LILQRGLGLADNDSSSVSSSDMVPHIDFSDKDDAGSVTANENDVSTQSKDSIQINAPHIERNVSSSKLSTVYPLEHKGPRIKIKKPYFMQHSPLNENRSLKPLPIRSIWDLHSNLHYKRNVLLYPRLMKCLLSQSHQEREEEQRRLAAERAAAAAEQRLAEEERLAAERKAQEEKRLAEELRFAADMRLADEKLKQERQRLAQAVQYDQENYRGTKRKHEEIQGNVNSLNQYKRTVLGVLC
jgi:hypothetical protein